MNKSLLAISVASLLCPFSYLHAEEYSNIDEQIVDETMVVLAKSNFNNSIEDIPANVVVITSDDISASGATSLDSLLRSRAGIQVSDTNSGPSFSLRGFSGAQGAHNTLILVDGRRLNKQDLSSPQLSSILVSQIERVEILSGSAGVLYGDQAVGGVINIITKSRHEDGGNISISGGEFDSFAGSVDVSRQLNERWNIFLSASQDNSDNYRDHNKRETGVLLGRLTYHNGVQTFFTEASYYDNMREYAGSLTKDQYEDDPTQASSSNPTDYNHEITRALRFGYKQALNESWLLDSDFYYDDTTGSGSSSGSGIIKTSSDLSGSIRVERQFMSNFGDGSILFGIDGSDRDYDSKSSFIDRENDQKTYSLYGQVNFPLSTKFTLTTGARYSSVEDNVYDATTYSDEKEITESQDAYELGLNYNVNSSQKVYLRGGTNFRFAKIDEQAYTSSGVHGLKPQTGKSLEAGWELVQSRFSLKVDAYYLELDDEIVFDSSAPKPDGAFFDGANVNADSSERYGLSVTSDVYVTDRILLGAEYHFIDAEFIKGNDKGNELPWVSKNSGRAFSTFELNEHWQLYLEGVYTGSRYTDGDTSNTSDKQVSYWLGNASIGYLRNAWSANLRVDNIFDEEYASSVNSWGAYYPGDGRKVMLTGNYRF